MDRKVTRAPAARHLAVVVALAALWSGCVGDNPGYGGAGGDAAGDRGTGGGSFDGTTGDGGGDFARPDLAVPRDGGGHDGHTDASVPVDRGGPADLAVDDGIADDLGRPDLGTDDLGTDDLGHGDFGTGDAGPDLGPQDQDEDGVLTPDDCDDHDPLRYPGAPERCDGVDDDCDGAVDEGIAGLGGDCSVGVGRCEVRGRGVCAADGTGVVCDARPAAAAPEVCNDQDDDCDGLVDEDVPGCLCVPAGELCNRVDDDCDGAVDEGVTNACGACGPVPSEACNALDDDCDGRTDEGVLNACGACGPVPSEVCDGQDQDCDGRTDEGVLNACGACGPVPVEACNALDDDCDGRTDEGVSNACGGCGAVPAEVCNQRDDDCDGHTDEGVLNACGGCGAVPAEVCNQRDDDCDGHTDEGLQNACGGCGPAPVEVCDGQDQDCDGNTDEGLLNACGACGPAPAEVCNQRDEDCDGVADEGTDRECRTDCGAGVQRCVMGSYGVCDAPVPVDEVCNGLDDDCDGTVDEGTNLACQTGCGQGVQRCVDGALTACSARVPGPETCDFVDNDCDGQLDEDQLNPCALNVAIYQGDLVGRFAGRQVLAIDDRTGDGVPEAVVSGIGGDGRDQVALVNGATGATVWSRSGAGEFGAALAYAQLGVEGPRRVVVGAPTAANAGNTSGAIYLFNADTGDEVARIGSSGTGRFGHALATYSQGGRDVLVVGEPDRAFVQGNNDGARAGAGRVVAFNYNRNNSFNVVFEKYGENFNTHLGQRLYAGPDLNLDGTVEVVATYDTPANGNQQLRFLNGNNGETLGQLSAPAGQVGSYGDAFAFGRTPDDGSVGYAVGAPDVGFGQPGVGIVLFHNALGQFVGQYTNGVGGAHQGAALLVWPRPDRTSDLLVIGSRGLGRIDFFDADLGPVGAVAGSLAVGSSVGSAMSISGPLANGTRRLFVAGPSEAGGRGVVVIYSVH